MQQNLAHHLRLMLVTDDRLLAGRDLIETCRAAERGGVTAVQVRLKEVSPRELVQLVRRLKQALTIPVLVNDRLDVALASGSDGVHLGPEDLPVELARKVTPPGVIIGASVGSGEEAENGRGADYWGVGPYRATGTKPDAGVALGPDGLRGIIELSQGRPCIAIGGIRPDDGPAALAAGACGVAVVSGILGERDPELAAKRYALKLLPAAGPA